MAFVAEDGTGLANANSFCTEAAADAYHADRNNLGWSGATQKQAALIAATDYIVKRWTGQFRGLILTDVQALPWPRKEAYDDDGRLLPAMPAALIQATAEYADRARSGALAPDPTIDATGGKVIRTMKQVGPIMTDTMFESGTTIMITRPYPAADLLLRQLVLRGGRVIRA